MANASSSAGLPQGANGLIEIQRRNFEAFAKVQAVLLDGFAAVTRQQIELAGALLPQLFQSFDLTVLEPDPRLQAAKGIDALKMALQGGNSGTGILTEIAVRANGEAAAILKDRFMATLDEMKAAWLAAARGQSVLPRPVPAALAPVPAAASATAD